MIPHDPKACDVAIGKLLKRIDALREEKREADEELTRIADYVEVQDGDDGIAGAVIRTLNELRKVDESAGGTDA